MYEFVTGPLAWLAFAVFFVGNIVRSCSTCGLTGSSTRDLLGQHLLRCEGRVRSILSG